MHEQRPHLETEQTRSAAPLLGDVEAQLRDLLQALEPAPHAWPQPGRPRVVPVLCQWGGLLVCVLRGFSS